MQIAYLNKGRAKAKSKTDEMLELAYLQDIRRAWNKNKVELIALGLTEVTFTARIKDKLRIKKGIYSQ